MSTEPMTLDEIRRTGLEALAARLGPDGMVRFLQQFETGSGDYTKDRHQWLKEISVEKLAADITAGREGT